MLISNSNQNLLFLFSSVLGYLFLAWYFLRALLFPSQHLDFIYSVGVVIFLLEFINIHSTGMLAGGKSGQLRIKILGRSGVKTEKQISASGGVTKGFLLFFYSIFYLTFFFISKNTFLVVPAFISFVMKVITKRAHPGDKASFAFPLVLLLVTTFIVVFLSGTLEIVFPFPETVYQSRPSNQSGLFVDVPQTMLFWGFLYYSLLGGYEIYRYFQPSRLFWVSSSPK